MSTSENEVLVDIQNVYKRYPNFELKDLCLTLPKGEIMGIVGPNGAGKSTSLALLMGFIHPESGNIKVLNNEIPKAAAKMKQEVAYVSEEMRLYNEFTIDWHIKLLEKLFPSWDGAYADHIIQRFDLNKNQKVQTLSLGQRVKTTLLLALARRPQLLVLDEPSTGLDPIARHELTQELMSIMLNEDNSVIFSSQFTQDIELLSDTITFMDEGLIISNKDKESYLDEWRRIEIICDELPKLPGIVRSQTVEKHHSVVYSNFTPVTLEEISLAGGETKQVQRMTLEEIFIEQISFRRRQKREAANYVI